MKKYFALAAILATTLTFTGCEMPFEIKMKGDGSESSSSMSSEKSSQISVNTNSTVKSDKPASSNTPESSTSIIPSVPSGDIEYEPVTNKCGDIRSNGDIQYFEYSYEYGNACSVIYTYNFKNGAIESVALRVVPGAETSFENIFNRHMVGEIAAYDLDDFTETAEGWVLSKEGWYEDDIGFFEGADIESMHSLMEMMS